MKDFLLIPKSLIFDSVEITERNGNFSGIILKNDNNEELILALVESVLIHNPQIHGLNEMFHAPIGSRFRIRKPLS